MKAIQNFALTSVILIFGAGCLTWTPSAQEAATAVSLVAPQYASAAAIVAGKANSKAATSTLEGFQYREVYRYKGTVCDAADVSVERIYSQTIIGSEVFAPTPATQAETPTTTTTDEQAADKIAAALDKLTEKKAK